MRYSFDIRDDAGRYAGGVDKDDADDRAFAECNHPDCCGWRETFSTFRKAQKALLVHIETH